MHGGGGGGGGGGRDSVDTTQPAKDSGDDDREGKVAEFQHAMLSVSERYLNTLGQHCRTPFWYLDIYCKPC